MEILGAEPGSLARRVLTGGWGLTTPAIVAWAIHSAGDAKRFASARAVFDGWAAVIPGGSVLSNALGSAFASKLGGFVTGITRSRHGALRALVKKIRRMW